MTQRVSSLNAEPFIRRSPTPSFHSRTGLTRPRVSAEFKTEFDAEKQWALRGETQLATLKLHVCMRPCKLDANKIQFHKLSSCVYTHCENKRGLSHRHSLPTGWIWDASKQTTSNPARWHVHVETQVLLIMKMIFTCLALNAFFCSIAAVFSFSRRELWWHRQHTWLYRYDPSARLSSFVSRPSAKTFLWGHGAMTTPIRGGGQKQSQFEPFFASRRHLSEINLKLPSCTHSLTPF